MSLAAVLMVETFGFSLMPAGATALMQSVAQSTSSMGAGTVTLSWDTTGNSALPVTTTTLTPGSSVQQVADLKNTGSVSLGTLQLALSESPAGSMSDGVTVALDRCSVPWSRAGAGYTCPPPGTTTPVSLDRPFPGLITVVDSPAATPGFIDHLRLTIGLAESSPTDAQGQTSTPTLTLIATGVQRGAMQR